MPSDQALLGNFLSVHIPRKNAVNTSSETLLI